MSSGTEDTPKVPPASDDDKPTDWPTVGGRCHPDDVKVLDLAAWLSDQKRGPFIIDAAVEKAKKLVKERGAEHLVGAVRSA